MATRLPQLPSLRRISTFLETEYSLKALVDYLGRLSLELTRAIDGGAGGGAPTNSEYLVGVADGTLSNERVVTDTATVTWDLSVAGQAKANVSAFLQNTVEKIRKSVMSLASELGWTRNLVDQIHHRVDPFRGRFAPGSFTISDGFYAIVPEGLTLSGSDSVTIEGTGMLVVISVTG